MGLRVGGVRPGGEREEREERQERKERKERGEEREEEREEEVEKEARSIPEGQFGPEHGLALQPRALPGDLFKIFP